MARSRQQRAGSSSTSRRNTASSRRTSACIGRRAAGRRAAGQARHLYRRQGGPARPDALPRDVLGRAACASTRSRSVAWRTASPRNSSSARLAKIPLGRMASPRFSRGPRVSLFGRRVVRDRRQPGRGRRKDHLVTMPTSSRRCWRATRRRVVRAGSARVRPARRRTRASCCSARAASAGGRSPACAVNGVEPLAFADNAVAGRRRDRRRSRVSPRRRRRASTARARRSSSRSGAPTARIASRIRGTAAGARLRRGAAVSAALLEIADDGAAVLLQDLPSRLIERTRRRPPRLRSLGRRSSRAEYVAQVRFRLADFDGLSHPVAIRSTFPTTCSPGRTTNGSSTAARTTATSIRLCASRRSFGTCPRARAGPGELRPAASDGRASFRLDAREDRVPTGGRGVRARHAVPRCHRYGVERHSATVHGGVAVTAETVEALVGGAQPTFIKLDIEGFEIDALAGRARTIDATRRSSRSASTTGRIISGRIPLLLREWREDYALFLRPHNEEGWDLVCYAVPRARSRWARVDLSHTSRRCPVCGSAHPPLLFHRSSPPSSRRRRSRATTSSSATLWLRLRRRHSRIRRRSTATTARCRRTSTRSADGAESDYDARGWR